MISTRREPVVLLRPAGVEPGERTVAIEAPVAVEVNGFGYAVMMMTPADFDAFAVGFLLAERLIDTPADIEEIAPFAAEAGWILRVSVARRVADRIQDRVRHRASDASCGLCGIAGLEQLHRPVGPPPRPRSNAAALFAALGGLGGRQPLHAATGAVHAAAACAEDGTIGAVFEDVGRHNALDKLVGALRLAGAPIGGFVLVTSRISFEMVDKALVAGAPMLAGISAPTSLAVDHARAHGLTLVALARRDAMLVLSDPWGTFGAVAEEGLEPPTPGL